MQPREVVVRALRLVPGVFPSRASPLSTSNSSAVTIEVFYQFVVAGTSVPGKQIAAVRLQL